MNTDRKIRELLAELLVLMKRHGTRSQEVKSFVREYRDVNEFAEYAATFIFVAETEDLRKSGKKIDSVFFDDVDKITSRQVDALKEIICVGPEDIINAVERNRTILKNLLYTMEKMT